MTSIYQDVFPRLPREQPPRSEKLDAAKATYDCLSTIELATEYARLDGEKDRIKEWLSKLQVQMDAIEQLLIVSKDRNDVEWGAYGGSKNTLRLASGDKLEYRPEIYCSISDADALRAWIVEQGLERLLGVHTQTLNGLVRPMLKNGESEPPGVSPYVRTGIRFTAMKRK